MYISRSRCGILDLFEKQDRNMRGESARSRYETCFIKILRTTQGYVVGQLANTSHPDFRFARFRHGAHDKRKRKFSRKTPMSWLVRCVQHLRFVLIKKYKKDYITYSKTGDCMSTGMLVSLSCLHHCVDNQMLWPLLQHRQFAILQFW